MVFIVFGLEVYFLHFFLCILPVGVLGILYRIIAKCCSESCTCCLCPCFYGYVSLYENIKANKIVNHEDDFQWAILAFLIQYNFIVMPAACNKTVLSIILVVIDAVILIGGFVFMHLVYTRKCCGYLDNEDILDLLTTIYKFVTSLFMIPIIENFVAFNITYGNKWDIIIYIIAIPIISTIVCRFLFVKYELSGIDDYKEGGYRYFDIFEFLADIAYTFCSVYNLILPCLGIECAVLLVLILVRPYETKYLYPLKIGGYIVVIASNCIAEFYSGILSTQEVLTIFGFAFVPAIVSYYVFILVDAGNEDKGKGDDPMGITSTVVYVSFFVFVFGYVLLGFSFDTLIRLIGR